MYWTKPLALVGVAVLAALTLGAFVPFVTTLPSDVPALVSFAFVAALVAGGIVLGMRSRRWRSNPYW